MESQYKSSMDGTQVIDSRASPRIVRSSDFFLRLLAISFTLVSTIILVTANETKVVSLTILPTLPPLNVPASAKWQYMSAFVYLVVSNAIACTYGALSLVISLANRGLKNGLALVLMVFDLMMVALLFSSNGATAAIGVIGYEGNSHVLWNKVCNMFGNYCGHVVASGILSLIGSLVFILLVLLAVLNLRKNSP